VMAGAGLSGLALAGGLQRSGYRVTVPEEASRLRTGGAAISVWNSGAMALKYRGCSTLSEEGPHAAHVTVRGI
jgi:2-polyprenyl-6-methoxyphenol hydroxylase-like FAD-dependent oxidoreductase